MKKRSLLVVVLVLVLLMAGCQDESVPNMPQVGTIKTEDVEPTAVYDWMAGESPIETRRIGLVRACVNNLNQAVSPTGTYFIQNPDAAGGSYILYADNGSDTLIKLCGRPDCTHTTPDCNAYLDRGNTICYYGGYLYAVTGVGANTQECKLIRMDPDGSNRVTMLDLMAFTEEHGGDYTYCQLISNGYLLFSTFYFKDTGMQYEGTFLDYYLYKLDGSMEEPKSVVNVDGGGMVLYNCNDVFLTYRSDTQNGGEYGSYWNWDPETDTITYMTDHPGQPGWFTEEEAYYFKDGAIRRLTYATQTEEVMAETGLEGDYYLFAFPDCMAVASRESGENSDNNLYIYNWAFELVDTVEMRNPENVMPLFLLIAETSERFILSDDGDNPKYYINKSELGTGNVEIHSFVHD